jgi:hypothetical protein
MIPILKWNIDKPLQYQIKNNIINIAIIGIDHKAAALLAKVNPEPIIFLPLQ